MQERVQLMLSREKDLMTFFVSRCTHGTFDGKKKSNASRGFVLSER